MQDTLIPFHNTATGATHWIDRSQIVLIHECVNFPKHQGIPHLNIYTLYGCSATAPTPKTLPITGDFIECFTLFDPDQHPQAQDLGLTPAPRENRRKFRAWLNPRAVTTLYENLDLIEFAGRNYFPFAVVLGESTVRLYFDVHPFATW